MSGIIRTYALPSEDWVRMQAAYGVAGAAAPVVQVAARGFSGMSFETVTFQRRSDKKGGRTSSGAAQAAAIAAPLVAYPGVALGPVDHQIIKLLSMGSSRAVIASLVGIGQATVKKRIRAMQERLPAKP